MKTNCKYLLLSLTLMLTLSVANAIEKPTKLYIYGFSASFNDSTVYLTDIMEVDSAWTDSKTKFLYSRDSYSYQLKSYLQGQGVDTPTCIVSFDKSRKKAEKKYLKLQRKYTDKKKGNYVVKYIAANDFKFEAVSAADDALANTAQNKKAAKAEKKQIKEKMKGEKGMKPGREGRPNGAPNGGPGGPGGAPNGGPERF